MVLFTSAIVVGALLLLGAALHALLAKSLYSQHSADAIQQVGLLTRQNGLGDVTGLDSKQIQVKLRDRLIEAEQRRLAGHQGPVIAAGSTGSIPAPAKLLATHKEPLEGLPASGRFVVAWARHTSTPSDPAIASASEPPSTGTVAYGGTNAGIAVTESEQYSRQCPVIADLTKALDGKATSGRFVIA